MTAKEYFDSFEAIAAISEQMLSAARGAAWTELPGLQQAFLQQVEELKRRREHLLLSEDERLRKYDLIRQILADDAQIRELANPCLARISALLGMPTHGLTDPPRPN